jgi:parvulin-like peptidyl-prolyl cis-trans isomerase-like protein
LIGRLLREPLLQFLALGAILFALYSSYGKRSETPEKIMVSAAQIANLTGGFARTWQRPPNEEEIRGLIENYIRDEVFYRAGKAAGLDRDDPVIRRRVRQKMEFLAEEIAVTEPTEQQLAAYLAENAEQFRTEDRLTLRQIFLSSSRSLEAMQSETKRLATFLAGNDAELDTASLGDPFLLSEGLNAVPRGDVIRRFGEAFAKQVFLAEPGRWFGPVASPYGKHFVFIEQRTKGGIPPLDEVRTAVARKWGDARRMEAEQKLYSSLREQYEITVEAAGPPAAPAVPRQ